MRCGPPGDSQGGTVDDEIDEILVCRDCVARLIAALDLLCPGQTPQALQWAIDCAVSVNARLNLKPSSFTYNRRKTKYEMRKSWQRAARGGDSDHLQGAWTAWRWERRVKVFNIIGGEINL